MGAGAGSAEDRGAEQDLTLIRREEHSLGEVDKGYHLGKARAGASPALQGWQSRSYGKQRYWASSKMGFEEQPPKRTPDIEDRAQRLSKDFDKGCDCVK